MSLIFAAQLSAIGTAVLAVFAIVTAVFAWLAFHKQSQEVHDQAEMLKVQSGQLDEQRNINRQQTEVLELQVKELRESIADRAREAGSRRRAQATLVVIMADPDYLLNNPKALAAGTSSWMTAEILNNSREPVYGAEVYWPHYGKRPQERNPEPVGTIMPGQRITKKRDFPNDANLGETAVKLVFRDAAGITWARDSNGSLTENHRMEEEDAAEPEV